MATTASSVGGSGDLYSLACVRCKRLKMKCDRTLPHCNNCTKSSHSCVYPASASKPGPKPGTSRRRFRTSRDAASLQQVEPAETLSSNENGLKGQITCPATVREPDDTLHECLLASLVCPGNHAAGHDHAAPPVEHGDVVDPAKFTLALDAIGISTGEALKLVDIYFDNMFTFSLFHKPTFHRKVGSIKSSLQIQALLMSLFAVARRYVTDDSFVFCRRHSPDAMLQKAIDLNEACIKEMGDEIAPLVVIQSMVLAAFLKLAQGIRSISYRLTGQCVRTAYDLELHLEDAADDPAFMHAREPLEKPRGFIEKEERRRTWWAIWECELFAANMKRLPPALAPYGCLVKLPCSDEEWFTDRPSPSCFLAQDPIKRWQDIQRYATKSCGAWTALYYAYKYDAFMLTVSPSTLFSQFGSMYDSGSILGDGSPASQAREARTLLENCVRSAQAAMPVEFTFSERYLSFTSVVGKDGHSRKKLDAARYGMHLIVNLTIFMLYRRDVYQDAAEKRAQPLAGEVPSEQMSAVSISQQSATQIAWDRYFQAAAAVSSVVSNSAPTAYKYVNPWLSNTLWYSCAAHVVTGVFGPPTANRQLIVSNFELIKNTLVHYVQFWGVPNTLVANLDSLGVRVQGLVPQDEVSSAVPSHNLYKNWAELFAGVDPRTYAREAVQGDSKTTDRPADAQASDAYFRPDMFEQMLTDEFMNEMLRSDAWAGMEMDMGGLFFEPLQDQTQ